MPVSQPDPIQRVDYLTIAGLGLLLMPLLTMWHEIGGPAAACVLQGGHVSTIGAFYVECDGLAEFAKIVVAGAGIFVNILLAVAAYFLWRRAVGDNARIIWWLVWVSEAFVASGYFLFSGVTGFGDIGIGTGGSLSAFGFTWFVQIVEIVIGLVSYILLIRAAIRALNVMIGEGPATRHARRVIAHLYYVSAGVAAVLVGLLNPIGIVIMVMSAAASSFGGLAGFISVGYAVGNAGEARPILFPRNLAIVAAGLVVVAAFALILGPSLHFPTK